MCFFSALHFVLGEMGTIVAIIYKVEKKREKADVMAGGRGVGELPSLTASFQL